MNEPSQYNSTELYDETYYQKHCGSVSYERSAHWLKFFGTIAQRIAEDFKPKSVLDAGCAIGMLVEQLRRLGVDAYGFDISEWAIRQMPDEFKEFISVGSILENPYAGKKFDLVTCIEVLEHLQSSEADIAIEKLCGWSDIVIFTSSPDDYKEATHFNVQQPGYWAEKFARNGFVRALNYDACYIAPWAQVFRRESLIFPMIARHYEDNLWIKLKQSNSQRESIIKLQHDLDRQTADIVWYKQEFDRLVQKIQELTSQFLNEKAANEQLSKEVTELRKIENERLKAIQHLERNNSLIKDELSAVYKNQQEQENRYSNLHENYLKKHNDVVESQKTVSKIQKDYKNIQESYDLLKNDYDLIFDRLHRAEEIHELINNTKAWKMVNLWWKSKERVLNWMPRKKDRLRSLYRTARIVWEVEGSAALLKRTQGFLKGERLNGKVLSGAIPAAYAQSTETPAIESSYKQWIAENEPDEALLDMQRAGEKEFSYRPLISILTPIYNTGEKMLVEMIESVLSQTYPNWELCLIDGCSNLPHVRYIIDKYVQQDNRIKIKYLDINKGISGNSNEGLPILGGEFTALLDHDDTLSPNALFEVVNALNQNHLWDFIYSDKDTMTEDARVRFNPLFKPDWSPDILFNTNYLTHLNIVRTKILREIGGFDPQTDGAQDWDLFFRVALKTDRILHLPQVLYHWRFHQTSTASGLSAKPYAAQGQLHSIKKYIRAKKLDADVKFNNFDVPQVIWSVNKELFVTVVIDVSYLTTNANLLIKKCIEQSLYPKTNIIVINRSGTELKLGEFTNQVKILNFESSAKIGAVYQNALKDHSTDVLVFLDSALFAENIGQVIHELVGWTQYEEMGVIGGLLLDSNGRVASTGLILGNNGSEHSLGAGLQIYDATYLGHLGWYRNFSALPRQCMAVRGSIYEQVGGFDSELDTTSHLDFCLRTATLNLRHFYTPYAVLKYRRNSKSLKDHRYIQQQEKDLLIKRHHNFFQKGDPYNNSHLHFNEGKLCLNIQTKQETINTVESISARVPVISTWDIYSQEAAGLASWFDVGREVLDINRRLTNADTEHLNIKSVTWFLPEFENAFYGGIHTILRFAAYFKEAHNVINRFVIIGTADPLRICNAVTTAFPSLANSEITTLTDVDSIDALQSSDASVCTLWTTAYYQLRFNQTRRKFYFIQDYEPTFYPAGSTSGQVEATYRFGYYGITNTVSLKTIYERDYQGSAEYFTPSTNPNVFYPPQFARPENVPYRVFFYVRPGHPRNAFELGISALRILKERMQDNIEIVTAGSDWDLSAYGLENIIKNYGLLQYEQTGDLYRTCHAGMAMMFTRHPSYIPFELMACKSLVVTNYNFATSWLFEDSKNCLLSEASAGAIAETVEKGLYDVDLRHRITDNAYRLIESNHYNWNSQTEKIYRYMCSLKTTNEEIK